MQLGKVVGTVVATQRDPKLGEMKFLLVQQIDFNNKPTGGYVVAVDAVGAGVGEVVMYATGSSARQTVLTDQKPCDATIMAIVDTWDIKGKVKFTKE
ncbi:MAG: EutN/CcmL family microcompartment protein [Planctomycetes bacterium]|nr:EutN/CcmL family microcompartment protein [Planctomycetota bacterium]